VVIINNSSKKLKTIQAVEERAVRIDFVTQKDAKKKMPE
jgi:hypothetical protein